MPGLQERARRIQGWAWRPKSCNIPHLDGAELDRLLAGGHEVLYAGDSTTQHAFYDLASCRLGADVVDDAATLRAAAAQQAGFADLEAPGWKGSVVVLKSGGRVRLARHDFLANKAGHTEVDFSPVPIPDKGRDLYWARLARAGEVSAGDYIVFNTGAHGYMPWLEQLVRGIGAWLAAHDFRGTVVYRSNYAGTPDCQNVTMPASATEWARDYGPGGNGGVARNTKKKTAKKRLWYDWSTFDSKDLVWARVGPKVFPRFKYLDVYTPTTLRTDAHIGSVASKTKPDCLHTCVPGGPVELWTDMLGLVLRDPNYDGTRVH
jgi:hypothetical protein